MRRWVVVAAFISTAAWAAELPPPRAERVAPLLEDAGRYRHAIVTPHPLAQRFFDQGLVLVYAFDRHEAARAFRQAQRLDPACALCYWGEALALGPGVGAKAGPDDQARAAGAIARARALAMGGAAGTRQRAYIEALAHRYVHDPSSLAGPDHAYAAAMGEVARAFPEDPDAAALYAQALLVATPLDRRESGGEQMLLDVLEQTLALHPEHPGANHLLIHVMEQRDPRRARAAAERLSAIAPAIAQLQHAAARIYLRLGRYRDAIAASERAIVVEEAYLAQCEAQGFDPVMESPPSLRLLLAAASFAGASESAVALARRVAARQDPQRLRIPGFETLQHYAALPLYVLVRFGRWDEILAEPQPPGDLPYVEGVWRYARGVALARMGAIAEAEVEVLALAHLAEDWRLERARIWGEHNLAEVLRTVGAVLRGEVAQARGEHGVAIRLLREAVRREDRLVHRALADWYTPARHHLGLALLRANQPKEAERVYREDLQRHPDNGWALYGLAQAMRAQNRRREASAVEAKFAQAWAGADVTLTASRY